MTWLKRILLGAGMVFVLLVALVLVAGYLSVDEGSVTQSMAMTMGSRTVTVGGHYQNMTQESLADGIKVTVAGHEIVVSEAQLTVDGKTQQLEPDQNVEVMVGEDGTLAVKLVASADGAQ